MTILITGATGNIGGEIIQHLFGKNVLIRGLVRDLKKGAKFSKSQSFLEALPRKHSSATHVPQ